MPGVTGILETAISVADPQQSAAFYRKVFGFNVLLESDRLIALDIADRSVLLLFKVGTTSEPFITPGGVVPGHSASGTSHFAFAVAAEEMDAWRQQLAACGVVVESSVNWPGGAESIYFRDPDNHLVELITPGFWRNR